MIKGLTKLSNIDYRTDLPKHAIRTELWLPACLAQKNSIRRHMDSVPLKYFTFCAAEAIDVFMLERAHVLRRSPTTNRLEGVYFCENKGIAFGQIARLIDSQAQGFLGDFEKIVLFEDNERTQGKTLYGGDDDDYSPELRKELQYKDAHERLVQACPFDIINLDVYGTMFPFKLDIIAPILASILKMLAWQSEKRFSDNSRCDHFTLLLTSHIDATKMNAAAVSQLADHLADNIASIPQFAGKFQDRYGHIDVEQLKEERFAEFFALAIPKYFIHKAIVDLGWDMEYGPTFLYNRPDQYTGGNYVMMHSTAVFKRIPNFRQGLEASFVGRYIRAVTELLSTGHEWIGIEDGSNYAKRLADDLNDIAVFRDKAAE